MAEAAHISVWASEPAHFVDDVAAVVAAEIRRCVAARGECRLALAGGGTPRPVYEALARDPKLDCAPIRFMWSDERAVGPHDESSNYRMACRAWLDHAQVPAEHVVRIEGERPPAEAAAAFERALGDAPLDIVLLGMGEDGHTASLFPGDPASYRGDARVVVTRSPVPPATRISLSMRAINEAALVLVLVTGQAKAARLHEAWRQRDTRAPQLPIAHVRPARGELRWLLDRPAARDLPQHRIHDLRMQS